MPELIAHVLTEGGADADAAADDLREYLTALPETDEVDVEVERPRLGLAEILTIVKIAKGAVELIKLLADYVEKHRDHIKGIEIELDGERIPIDKLTDEQRARVTAALSG